MMGVKVTPEGGVAHATPHARSPTADALSAPAVSSFDLMVVSLSGSRPAGDSPAGLTTSAITIAAAHRTRDSEEAGAASARPRYALRRDEGGTAAMADTPEPADEELVRRMRAGDAAAARLLFERHLPALRAKARARLPGALRGKLGASDVVQEAYLSALLSLPNFEDRGDGSFKAWLRTILERRLANEIRDAVGTAKRDARREVRIPTGTGGAGAAGEQPSPSEEAMAEEDAARLRAAREGLTPDQRTVIALVHDEGLTLAKAGERMGRSADARSEERRVGKEAK